MPITKSAKKALRAAETKTSTNRYRKELLKEALRTASPTTLSAAVSAIDKAAKWGIIHPNKAARLKSALTKKFPATAGSAKTKKTTAKAAPKATKTSAKKPTARRSAKK